MGSLEPQAPGHPLGHTGDISYNFPRDCPSSTHRVLPQSSPDTAGCAPVAYATRGHFLVSNPCCSPRFRTSASVATQRAAFAVGVPSSIYEFDLYTRNSTLLYHTQVDPPSRCSMGKPWNSSREVGAPPTCPLRPVIPENACTLCLRLIRGFPRGSDYAFNSLPNLGHPKEIKWLLATLVCVGHLCITHTFARTQLCARA